MYKRRCHIPVRLVYDYIYIDSIIKKQIPSGVFIQQNKMLPLNRTTLFEYISREILRKFIWYSVVQ